MTGVWLDKALAVPVQTSSVDVAGATISYLSWRGPSGAPGVVLVHGMFAHAHWWDAVAPYLARDFNVVALDLSGMGDSDFRPEYRMSRHAEEIVAVTRNAGLEGAALVGHSYGGSTAVMASLSAPHLFRQLVILDSRIPFPGVKGLRPGPDMPRLKRIYPTCAEALTRFRLIPPDPLADPLILAHVAEQSLRETNGGWRWKFDDTVAVSARDNNLVDPAELSLPVVFMHGEESFVTPADQMELTRQVFPNARFVALAGAGHHLMIDRPVEFTNLLHGVLQGSL